jgi:hypothetical protein
LSDTGSNVTPNDNIAAFNIHSDVAVTPVNDAPTVVFGTINGFTEPANGTPAASSTPVTIAPNLTVSDVDSANLSQATFVLNNLKPSDALSVSGHAGASGDIGGIHFAITNTATTETVTLTGTDTVAHYNAVLDLVQFNNTSENPDTTARSYTVTAVDDGTGTNTGSASTTESVTAVDDAPVNNGVPGQFTVMSGFTHAITGLSITDVDAGAGNDITTTLTSVGTAFVTVGAVGGGATITGNGTNAVTLTGTIGQINTSLGGSVVYTAADNVTTSSLTTLTIATDDHGHTGTGGPLTDTDIVSVGVTPQVWFIDQAQTGLVATEPRGSQLNPFSDITEFNAASLTSTGPGNNDTIYIKAGTYTGPGINLKDGQTLLGDDQALSQTDPFGGPAIVIETSSGARPTINVTTGGDQAIDLGVGNTIHGINITTAAGTTGLDDGQGAGGNAVGTLTVDQMAISGAGQAVDIDQGGALNVSLESLSSSGGAEGIQLAGTASSGTGLLSGTFSAGTGGFAATSAISGSTTAGILVGDGGTTASAGGTVAITYNGTVTTTGTAHAVDIQDRAAGAGNIGLGGTISHASGNGSSIFLDQDAAGTIAFSGANSVLNSGTTDAVHIANNGATVNFTGGGLNIDATSGAGFTASGGGTVSVTGSGNHLTTGAGTALNVVSTTIGANGLTFEDISASGGTHGIVLNNTGSGGLTVTGTGTTDGSGGTISSTTDRGASFIGASNISLSNMNFTNAGTTDLDADNSGLSTGDNLATNAAIHLQTVTTVNLDNINISGGAEQGINGNTVANFTLSNSSVTNVGNGPDEDGLHFYNMSGSSAITNTTFTNTTGDDNVNIQNQSGTLDLAITGGSATGGGAQQGSGYLFGIRGTSNATIDISGVTSSNNFSGGIVADAFDNSTMNIHVTGSTVQNNNDGISLSANQAANVDADISGNTLASTTPTLDFVPLNILGAAFSTGVFDARIANNNITVANGVTADGMTINELGGGQLNALVTGNTLNYAGTQRGILIQTGQDGNGAEAVTVTNNNIDMQLDGTGNAVNGILAQSAITGPGNTSSLDLNILNNTFTHSLGGTLAGGDIRVRQRMDGTINLDNYGGGGLDTTAAATYLNGRNTVVSASTVTVDGTTPHAITGNATPAFITVSVSPSSVLEDGATNLTYTLTRTGSTVSSLVANFAITGTASPANDFTVTGATTFNTGTGAGTVTFTAGSATAVITVNPTADSDATEFNESVVLDVASGSFARGVITDDAPMRAAAGGVQASSPTPGVTHLTQAQLDSVVAAAISQWEHAGASASQIAALHAIAFSVANLAGDTIGARTPGHIVIDADAAGHGWFVDSTPGDNSEFTHAANASGTDLYTDAANAAAGHLDLLTVVTHEMGHELGLDDSTAATDVHDLMFIDLVDGERRLPDATDIAQVNGTGAAQAAEAALPLSAQAAANTPIVVGTAGNDTINAGHGGNILFGGAGADNFVFGPATPLNAPTPAQLTHVADYSAAQGDTFDFSALTSQFHNSGVSDALVVRAVEDASGKFATLQVDTTNSLFPSAANWVNIAQLDGAHAGDSVNVLIDNHSVHLAQIHVDLLV